MSVIAVTKDNFRQEVLESELPVLVDFWATWCNPCRMLAPIIHEIADEHPEIKVCKIDVDEQPELASQFQVMSIPTLFIFKDGQVVNSAAGVRPKQQILNLIP